MLYRCERFDLRGKEVLSGTAMMSIPDAPKGKKSISWHGRVTVHREYASLESIQDNYEKLVVSLDDFRLPSNEGIRHVRAWELSGWL